MHANVNGNRINYSIDGPEGAPWLTLVTGIANDLSMWGGQMPALAGDLRVLRYDLRSQGGSQATPPPYTPDLLIGDLVGLWDALGIERTHLAGLGLGGSLALGTAIKHPDRIDRLAPCCCRASMVPDFEPMWNALVDEVKANGLEAIVERTAQRWFTDDFKAANPQVIEGVRAMIRGTSLDGYLGCISAILQIAYEDEIHRIGAPTLFVSGGDDKLGGPPALMQGLAAKVPGARHVSVPRAAHIANLQNEAGFNAILAGFLIRGEA